MTEAEDGRRRRREFTAQYAGAYERLRANPAPDATLSVEQSHAESFGRLVHALLALPDAATTDLTVTARTLAMGIGLDESEAAVAADLAKRACAVPEIAAANSADLVYRELPFAVPIDGKLATGRIDLVYRKDGEWTIIDFKTAGLRDPARLAETYGPQLETYRRALASITGQPIRAVLCLLLDGRLWSADKNDGQE